VSWLWGGSSWTVNYFQLAYSTGWGYQYQSDYSLPVVLAYVAAHLSGIVAYAMARRCVVAPWALLPLILCLLGSLSFAIEASHWLWNHHLSLIASCPVASLLLAIVVGFQLGRGKRRPAQSSVRLGS
jgi:hypothetical protein